MDIIDRIYQFLFYSSTIVAIVSGAFAVYNWYYPMDSSNPYGGIIAGMFEVGAIGLFAISLLLAMLFYKLMP